MTRKTVFPTWVALLFVGLLFFSGCVANSQTNVPNNSIPNIQSSQSKYDGCVFPKIIGFAGSGGPDVNYLSLSDSKFLLDNIRNVRFESIDYANGWEIGGRNSGMVGLTVDWRRGSGAGENINYLYCGWDYWDDVYVIKRTKVSSEGTIAPTESKTLKLIFDMSKPPVGGKYPMINPQCQYD